MSEIKKKAGKSVAYDQSHKVMNLHLVVTITTIGLGEAILYLLEKHEVSGQFVLRGEGTSKKVVEDYLNANENRKDVLYSLVKDNKLDEVMTDLSNFLTKDKKINGVAFAIPLESIAGRTAYHFLTQTIE